MDYRHLFGDPDETGSAQGTDGTRLHWERYGKPTPGVPTLVCCNGIGCTTFFWHYMSRHFATCTDVILWDYRGHGRSGRPVNEEMVGMEDNADDLEAVLSAAMVTDAVLIGHSMGSQVILEYYRRYPGKVRGLVPLLGTYGKPIDSFFDSSLPARIFPYIYSFAVAYPQLIQLALNFSARSSLTLPMAALTNMVNGTLIKKKDLIPYLEHLAVVDVRLFMQMVRRMGTHTTEDILREIKVPVLIIGGEKDIYTPVWCSEKMHRMIPNSEMLMLPGGSHAAIVEQPELINLRLEKFYSASVQPAMQATQKMAKKAARAGKSGGAKSAPAKMAAAKKIAPGRPKVAKR